MNQSVLLGKVLVQMELACPHPSSVMAKLTAMTTVMKAGVVPMMIPMLLLLVITLRYSFNINIKGKVILMKYMVTIPLTYGKSNRLINV